jgi:transcriptional regulator with GAF, ATPase, and Fis domain
MCSRPRSSRWASRVAESQDSGAMDFDFNRVLAEAVHEMAEEQSIATTLERIVQTCVEAVEHCDMAGVSILEHGEISTMAASDDTLRVIDHLQFELGEGPCFDALTNEDTVTSNDLAHDERWPTWGSTMVSRVGMRSVLSFRLATRRDAIGALNLYAAEASAFDHEDMFEGQVLAAHTSVVLAANLKEEQLHRALESRTVIGQATGRLIERFGLDADQAFAVMRRVSQDHNIKIYVLAQHLVETGVLLDPWAAPKDDGQAGVARA